MKLELGTVYRDLNSKQWRITEYLGRGIYVGWDKEFENERQFNKNGQSAEIPFPDMQLVEVVGHSFEQEDISKKNFLCVGKVYKNRRKKEFKIIKSYFANVGFGPILFLGVSSNLRKSYSFMSTGRYYISGPTKLDLVELVGDDFTPKKISLLIKLFNFIMGR